MALPRWTWRRAAVELLCTLAFAWLLRHYDAPPVSMAFWGIFVSIITGIWHAFQAGAQITVTVLVNALKWLKGRVFDIGRLLGGSIAYAGRALRDLAGSVVGFFQNVVAPAFSQFYSWAKRGIDLFQKGIGTVIGWVQQARRWVLDLYNQFVGPVIGAIDKVRRALSILAAVGVDGAGELARRIGLVEEKIARPVLDVVGKMNEVIGVLNRVMSGDGLFQRLTLFGSLFRDREEFTNFTIRRMFQPRPGGPTPPRIEKTTSELIADDIADMTAFAERRETKLTPAQQEWIDDVFLRIKRAA